MYTYTTQTSISDDLKDAHTGTLQDHVSVGALHEARHHVFYPCGRYYTFDKADAVNRYLFEVREMIRRRRDHQEPAYVHDLPRP